MKTLIQPILKHRRAYITLNILYYGLVILGMIYVAFNPDVQTELLQSVRQSFDQNPLLAPVSEAYGAGQVLRSMGLTFIINLVLGTLIQITLPSMIIPGLGLLLGMYRAILWGLLLSPANLDLAGPMIPHSLTLLLEGQGYILAMLGVYILAFYWLRPKPGGFESRWQGYKAGLASNLRLIGLAALVLALAAIYEPLEVIFLAPLFR